jgi:hypothetical protein
MSELFKNGIALMVGGVISISGSIVFLVRWIKELGG